MDSFMGDLWVWLVVEPTPLKNMSSSIGMMIPNGKVQNVPVTTNQTIFHSPELRPFRDDFSEINHDFQ